MKVLEHIDVSRAAVLRTLGPLVGAAVRHLTDREQADRRTDRQTRQIDKIQKYETVILKVMLQSLVSQSKNIAEPRGTCVCDRLAAPG